jgi:hypothetical protein
VKKNLEFLTRFLLLCLFVEIGSHLVEENATLKEEAQSFRSKVRSQTIFLLFGQRWFCGFSVGVLLRLYKIAHRVSFHADGGRYS